MRGISRCAATSATATRSAGVGIVSSRYAVVADNVLTGNNSYGVGFWAGAGVQDVGHHLLGGNVYDKNKVGEIQIGPDHPAIRQLGPGVVVPTDGPPAGRIYPKFVAQWKVAGLSLPSSQWDFFDAAATPTWTPNTEMIRGEYVVNGGNVYRCVTEGTTAASGGPTGTGTSIADGTAVWTYYGTGTGVIRDLVSTKDLLIVGTVEPGQFRTGFNQPFIRLTETDSESLQLNSPAYHPGNDAVAVVLDFEVTQSSGTWTIVQLGNGNASAGGGGMLVRVTATGRLELNADGVTVTGATNYEADGAVHRMVVAWDPTANGGAGLWFVATDAEIRLRVTDTSSRR